MACEAEKKLAPSAYDNMYGGLYGGKVYGTGKIDRFQGWSRFNAATLNDSTRIGSFSKEDSYNFGKLYNLHEEDFTIPPKADGLKRTTSAKVVSHPPDTPRPARSISGSETNKFTNSQSGSGRISVIRATDQKPEAPIPASTPRIRHTRSVSTCVPPFGGFAGKPNNQASTSPPGGLSTSGSPSPPADGAGLRREGSGRLHRRGSSDMGALGGLFSGDGGKSSPSNTNSGSESGRSSHGGSDNGAKDDLAGLKLKVGSSGGPSKENGNSSSSCGGNSSRGSSVTGSPTVGRTSSAENLFSGSPGSGTSSAGSPTSTGGSAHVRSPSGNVGNLLGAISSGTYTGGGLNTGASTPRMTKSLSMPPTIAPPSAQGTGMSGYASNGKVMFGGGSMGAKGTVAPDTPRASADAFSGRGNIHAVGESLHIKRMLTSSDPEEVKKAGNDQYKKGNFQEALTLYDRAVQLAPGKAPYRSNRAAALTGLGRLPEAVRECEEAIKLDSTYLRAHQRLASLHLRLGRVQSAKRHFRLAGQQTDVADLMRMEKVEKHVAKCFEARKAADWDTVVRESDAAVVAGADCAPQVFSLKAEAFLKLHRHEEADTVLLAAQKVEVALRKVTSLPADTTTLLVQAQIDMTLGRFEGAVIAAEKAAYFDPKNTEVSPALRQARAVSNSRTQGNDLYKAGKVLEACVAYSEGLQYHPSNAILLCNRAACRSRLGHYEKAVEDCTAALDAQPNYIKALLRRATCYLKMERWDQALKDYERLRKEMPGDLEIAKTLFQVQLALKKSKGEKVVEKQHGGEVEEIGSNEQLRKAISQPGVAVVQFNTKWSERCRNMSSYVEQLCKLNPSINFLKVDVEENPYLAKAEGVSFVPTFKIYKNGFKVKDIIGPTHQALESAVSHFSM